jgi:hypothetical protein
MTHVLASLILLLAATLASGQAPVLLRGPYLQMANSTSLTVCWRTDLPGTGRVRCGTEEKALTLTFDEAQPATDHEVRLTGLTPATRYFYAVETDGAALAGGAEFHFFTPPAEGADVPVRFWVLGDPGTANIAAQVVRDAFAPVHAQRRADFWLMLGDNAYPSGEDVSFQAAVFDMYPDYLKTLPLWSCLGNHETYAGEDLSGQYAYERIFVFPAAGECGGVASGTERYFSWNYGPLHFISLDSMTASRDPEGPMAQWLIADLQANTQPWVIAFWHHPPYSRGTHNSDYELELIEMREHIVPILEAHGVDLVLCGHSHNYERSWLMDGHYGSSDTFTVGHKKSPGTGREDGDGPYYKAGAGMTPRQGAVYVTAGSSGQAGGGLLNHPAHFIGLSELGSLVVDVNGPRMDVKFLRESTDPAQPPRFDDYFTIIKGEEPPPLPQLARGPYLQMAASDGMTVCWRTEVPSTGRVRFGTAPGTLHFVAEGAGQASKDHSVRLTGLAPGVKYYYRVEASGYVVADGPDYHFTTPPAAASGAATRIWLVGEAGTGTTTQLEVRDAFQRLHSVRPASLWILLGGNARPLGSDSDYQDAVFDVYHPFLHQVPLWSCFGAVDASGPSLEGLWPWDGIFHHPANGESGGVPSGSERYYSWNHGNLHFVVLDTVASPLTADGVQAQWLTADLQANTRRWTIVCCNHSPYTRGTVNSDSDAASMELRASILPILDQHGADLVFSAHSQVYERSWLLSGHYGAAAQFHNSHKVDAGDGRPESGGAYLKYGAPAPGSGIVYVVAGTSGALAGGGPLNHPAHCISLDRAGSVVLDVTGDRLDCRFLRESAGTVVDDHFTVLKSGPPRPVPPSGLAVLPLTLTTALLRWDDNNQHEDRYGVLTAPPGGSFSTVASSIPRDATGYTLTGLSPGAAYDAVAVAFNIAGNARSAPLRFTQPAVPVTTSPAEAWRFLHWGTTADGGDRGFAADADGDGFLNLLEYALGTSPRLAGHQPDTFADLDPNGTLAFSFLRQAAPELTYQVELSDSLETAAWSTVWTSSGAQNTAGMVTVTDPEPGAGRRFARLKVTLTGG